MAMFNDIINNPLYLTIIALFGAMIFVGWVNSNWFLSTNLLLLKRWLNAAFFSFAGAVFLQSTMPDRPLIVLVLCSALIYFLFVTAFFWFQISAENTDTNVDFLSKFEPADYAWSALKKDIDLKNKIEELGFKKSGSFKMLLDEEIEFYLYVTTFDSADSLTRLYFTFPFGAASFMMCSAKTVLDNGKEIITSAHCLPDTCLAVPEKFEQENHPMLTNPLKLLKIHQRRLLSYKARPVKTSKTPLADLNDSKSEELSACIKKGYINPSELWEEEGVFSAEGKYRMWLDIIKTSYFPFL